MFLYSFWADEAFISGIAMHISKGLLTLEDAFLISGVSYQKLYVLLLSLFFRVFSFTEFTARLPSILIFLFGIFIIYKTTKLYSNVFGAIIASFLYCASSINLAYATQAKPYIFLEVFFLLLLYFSFQLKMEKGQFFHLLAPIVILIAYLTHKIGILFIFFYIPLLLSEIKKIKKFYLLLLIFLLLVLLVKNIGGINVYNHVYQVVKLFLYKYSILTMSAFLGLLVVKKRSQIIFIALASYIVSVLVATSFLGYIFNIRYVLTLFGLMFFLSGIFWSFVGEKYNNLIQINLLRWKIKGRLIIPMIFTLLIFIAGYKVVRTPQSYYNPNTDKYGDVQIANYKDFYAKLKRKFSNYKSMYVVNDIFDTDYWYFGRHANAYFMKFTKKPYQHTVVKNAMVYGTLTDFKKIIKEHPQGLLIMEDWQSFLPDDVKEYAKKNLHLEFRVESLKEAPNDPWPLALYSWGMEK
jgi:hypothetical protein